MAEELYPGASYASPFMTAQLFSPLAQFPGQITQSMQVARQQARADEQLALQEEQFVLRKQQIERQQELEDIDRSLWAEQYPEALSPGRRRRRTGGYGGGAYGDYGDYGGYPQAPSRTTRKTRAEPDTFTYDPSGDPARSEMFGSYAERQAANEEARRRAEAQAQALQGREEATGIIREMFRLQPDESIPVDRVKKELDTALWYLDQPQARPGFYINEEGREVRAITPKQKALAQRQAGDREMAEWGSKRFGDFLGGLTAEVAPEAAPESVDVSVAPEAAAPVAPAPAKEVPGDPQVAGLQQMLSENGFTGKDGRPLVVDGVFGPRTEFALREFQGATGIPVTGRQGLLEMASGTAPAAAYPSGFPDPPPSAEVYLREMGLLEPGEEITDITSLEEMMRNPAIRVGLDPTYSDTPNQFAAQIYKGYWGTDLNNQEKAQVVQDYDKFYGERMGERREVIGAERARQQQAHLEALQARADRMLQAQVDVLRKQPAYKKDSEEKLRNIAWANLQDNAAFKATVSDITELEKSARAAAPKHRAVSLDKEQWKYGTDTDAMRVQSRYDDSVGGFINEYKDALAAAAVIPTNQDGTYKSAGQLKKEIGTAIIRLKGEGIVVPGEATRQLMEFHNRATRAQHAAEARREEKIPVPKVAGEDDDLSSATFFQGIRDLENMDHRAWLKAANEAKIPLAEQQRLTAAFNEIGLKSAGTTDYEAALTQYKEMQAEFAKEYKAKELSPTTFKPDEYMSESQIDRRNAIEGRLFGPAGSRTEDRPIRPQPGSGWVKKSDKGRKVWFDPVSKQQESYYLDEE